ncbi:MAG: hypothetical protein AB1640_20420 [bacterium]
MNRRCCFLLACFLSLSAQGCSTFTSYPERIQGPLESFQSGKLEGSFKEVEGRWDKRLDKLVWLLEGAMVLHTDGRLEQSNEVLARSEELIEHYEQKAVVSVTDTASQGASLVLNEKTIPYEGEPFEKVLVNTYKAMNDLFLRRYEEARVEIRRSFARQQENRRRHEEEMRRLEARARRERVEPDAYIRGTEPYYRDQQEILRRVKNPYEDPFAYYLSALIYELNGEYNDAYIDLERIQEIRPGVPCVEDDLLRMASQAGLSDAYRTWSEALKRTARVPGKDQAEVFVFFETGMAPRKQEIRVPLPIPNVGILSLALPKYAHVPSRIAQAALYGPDGSLLGETSVLTDLEAVAVRNLDDRMPALLIKQVLRASAKGAVAATAQDQGGALGALAANVYNWVSEQADLRCWTTLPRTLQAARMSLPAGRHDLVLAFRDAGGQRLQDQPFSVEARPGAKIFVHARSGTAGVISFHVY